MLKKILYFFTLIYFGMLTKNALSEPFTLMGLGAAGTSVLAQILGLGAAGAGMWGLSALGGKQKKQEDPLAGIRQQLMALSGQVPGMVERQKTLIGQRIGEAKKEGIESIGENVYAERGLGRTSIYDRLRNELIDKLAKTQAESELQAEMGGLELQGGLLGRAGGFVTPETPEEPSLFSKALGMGASLVGQQYGLSRLENILKEEPTWRYPLPTETEQWPDYAKKYRLTPTFINQ